LDPSLDLVVALLGIFKAGGAYVPLDPTYPRERLAAMLEDAHPAVILTHRGLRPAVEEGDPRLFDLDQRAVAALQEDGGRRGSGGAGPDEVAYVIFTSGSTGRPKGVMICHEAIVNRLLWMQRRFPQGESDRVLQKTAISFDASVWELFLPLLAGARLVMAAPGGAQDSAYLVRTVVARGITVLQLVPSMLRVFLDEEGAGACASLRRIFCGGEALPGLLADDLGDLLDAQLNNLYGPTECSIDITSHRCREVGWQGILPIGKPLDNMRVYLLDRRFRLVPVGLPGELLAAGMGLARGYLGRPARTAESFVPDPFAHRPGQRLYRTGDLCRRREDGVLEFQGRIDHQVKLRGFRIELGEVEAWLGHHPAVRETVAMVRQDKTSDGRPGAARLVAYVVPQSREAKSTEGVPKGATELAAELRKHIEDQLPYYMVPSNLVILDSLPRAPNGKIDRQALLAPETVADAGSLEPPRTPTEEVLAVVWGEILGVERLGRSENVFQLGWHSLMATQLISRLRRLFGVELSLRSAFEFPTVAEFGAQIDAALRVDEGLVAPPMERVERTQPLALSFAQHRLWFLDRLEPGSPFYNVPIALELTGPLEVAVLAAALAEVRRRHQALRTTFEVQGEEAVQVIAPSAPLPLPVVDLASLTLEVRRRETRRLVSAEAVRPFDLARGPLLRALLLRITPSGDEHVGLLNMHHIVSDGWSTSILTRELGALYAAFRSGQPSPLPELALQYADFAAWQREWLRGEVLESHLTYWRQQLADAPPLLRLPSDRPRPAVQSFRGAIRARKIPLELTSGLHQLSRDQGVTLFMVLLAAGQTLLGWYAEQDDVVVGTDVANRNRIETEGLIGFFINQLALRTRLDGNPEFRQVLERVRRVTCGAYAHQDLPFDKLVDDLNPERALQHSPIFQAKLSLINVPALDFQLENLKITPLSTTRITSQFDWILNFMEMEDGLGAWIEYNTDLFDALTIDRMLGTYEELLNSVIKNPEIRLSKLGETLEESESRQRIAEQEARKGVLRGRLRKARRKGGGGHHAEPAVRLEAGEAPPTSRRGATMASAEGFALSPQQRHLWRLGARSADRYYRAEAMVRIGGDFETEVLRQALENVVARYEILRTRFECLDGMNLPLQFVGEVGLAWEGERQIDALGGDRAHDEIFAELTQGAAEDGEQRPLRALLLRPLEGEPRLALSLPSLCADRETLRNLVEEVASAYGACLGKVEAMDEPMDDAMDEPVYVPMDEPLQFADLAAWLNELLESEENAAERQPWLFEECLPLLADGMPMETPPASGFTPRVVPLALGSEVVEGRSAEPIAFLLACWQLFLWHHLDRSDLVVSPLSAGRGLEELEGALGPLAHSLPIRTRPLSEDRFPQPARRASRALQQAAAATGAFSWELLAVGDSAPEDVAPGFTFVGFSDPQESVASQGKGTRFSLEWDRVRSDRFSLQLSCVVGRDGLRVALHYDAARFDGTAAELLGRRFEALVRRVAAVEDQPLGAFEVLTEEEHRHLVVELNRTQEDFGAVRSVHELVSAQAERTPEKIALLWGEESLTYKELKTRAWTLAHGLRRLGLELDEPVAILAERSPEMVVGLLGILAAGGAYVPLDPDHPSERLAAILANIAPRLLVADERLLALLPAFEGTAFEGTIVDFDGFVLGETAAGEDLATQGEKELPAVAVDPGNLAYIIHTSGSTGRPKGVMVSHRAITNRLLWMQREFPLGGSDRVLQKTPYSFDASIWEIFCPLIAGAEVVLARPGGHMDSAYLVREVEASGITVLQLVPSLLLPFLEESAAADCTSLRRVFCGGEELTTALAEQFASRLEASLHNLYGPTETAIDATFWSCRSATQGHGVPIGRPLANLQVFVLSPRLLPVPAEVSGELFVGGEGLARGYRGRPGETAWRFLPNPWSALPGERLYRTGDLVRRRAGSELEYLGRLDRQVKIRGARIELREIEAVLTEHRGVGQAVVIALPEKVAGEGARLAAYLVAEGDALDLTELRRHASERLPTYMLPGALMVLRSLPRLPSGKIDRHALPEPVEEAQSGKPGLPRTPSEEMLVGAWAEVLGVEAPGIHENFFDLGGHSLRATQLITRLRQLFEVELSVRDLFQRPTIAELGEHVDVVRLAADGLLLPPLVAVPRDQPLPLSFAQQRLWFLEQLRSTSGLFNIPDAVRFLGPLQVAVLAAAISELVRRHESLRTCFATIRGKAVQVIQPASSFLLPVVDFIALPPSVAEPEAVRRITELSRRPFDLASGPLFRVVLLKLQATEHLLSLTVHHIVSDAWSMGVVLRELATLYGAYLEGEPSPLAEPTVQYADFASWQREWLQGELLERELKYWREQMRGAPPVLELPADRPRPETPSWRGETLPVRLPAALLESLNSLGRQQGVTLFMTLLALFQVLLRFLSNRDDIVVGTDVANRNRAETEGVVGFFINQLALRGDLSGDPPFADLLARVREVALGAYAHQDVPFDFVVDALLEERSLRHASLFQVKLFVENTPTAAFELPELRIEPLEVEIKQARLDLILAFWERPEGLVGWINFNTDLFDTPRIERILRQFSALATAVTSRPEAPLSELQEVLAAMEKEERAMEKKALHNFSFKSFKAVQPKTVTLPTEEVVERSYLEDGQKLPLVIRPRVADVDLADWASAHVETLEADLVEHGAILFRGFGIDSPPALEEFASVLCPGLFNENSEHPRESVSGNIYTPVFYPPDQQLLWHNENSFNHSWPRKIFFCCAHPAEEGGETPLVDSRRLYKELDPAIRRRFEEKGVIYQRNYGSGLGLSWQTVFRTKSSSEAEERCHQAKVEFDWREGDGLCTLAHRPAVAHHPTTGEATWFNQAQHWHVSCLDPETRTSMRKLYQDDDLPRQCRYGDGTAIEDADMAAILDLYRDLEVSFRWQRGDVLMVDNVLAAHGRNPFKGERKILVALGQMTSYDEVGG
jgi:amino acid adenylation domain-containing protein